MPTLTENALVRTAAAGDYADWKAKGLISGERYQMSGRNWKRIEILNKFRAPDLRQITD